MLIRLSEAAKQAQVTYQFMRSLVDRGRIPEALQPGGIPYRPRKVRASDVDAWIRLPRAKGGRPKKQNTS